jgi:hypothetical protein
MLIETFLGGLHPAYLGSVSTMRMNETMPDTIEAVQKKIRRIEAMVVAQASNVRKPDANIKPSEAKTVMGIGLLIAVHGAGKGLPRNGTMTDAEHVDAGHKRLSCCNKWGKQGLSEPYQG